jgi:hypothetical protein
MDDKIIVTNRSALVRKYSSKGLAAIRKALRALTAADKKRGLKSRVVYLDDKSSMKKMGGAAVMNASSPRENKAAIDAVFKSIRPDYLMILGAPDVVPHQDLHNPAYSPPDDDDNNAWGDLPYACDAPYSRDPAHFVGPTRVIGRLPDLVGADEPSYLLTLLKTDARYRSRTQNEYMAYFGLSAAVWKGSTRLSLNNIFGNANRLLFAPPSGPNFSRAKLHVRAHLINCHGGLASPEFQGQKGRSYPIALTSKATVGKIAEGTVASVECCYGAELYDAITLGIDLPICQNYLRQGAYGYLGSTTIAYGSEDDNGSADFICQYFLLNVLNGASIGRAALRARQQFVENTAQMDPFDLKTLAQFCLLGDPSVHPVARPGATGVPKGTATADAERFFRAERRAKLRLAGAFLTVTKPTASKRARQHKLSPNTRTALSNIAKLAGLRTTQRFTTFAVKAAPVSRGRAAKAVTAPSRYHITIGTPGNGAPKQIRRGVAVVAKELDGRIVGYRVYHQR